ncbi:VWA domain-containing protein [Clostridiaceae bacterium UIB06]|uniref:VWA domain-containing protein n=1 Tax=Clostridium thailandense TaxID=2794346 RepID=A0A949TMF3_9CLOT|nr:vWA domain-containing protein [Clostridium thailandense]MBV7273137.1 VWA domain-containing protein [Clostridium thailandense]MCH5137537.1 VWA domain-containing protein [Clostridiaceae bacterium UIB06]
MVEKRINLTMLVMSTIGGVVGFIIGEVIIGAYRYKLSHSVLMGVYFGVLALCIGGMCLIAEMINPRLNGFSWKNNYLKTSFKFLIPCTLIMLFIAGMLFQFLYETGIGKVKKISDVVFVMDTSGSMSKTDPNNERFSAALDLLDSMNEENRVSFYRFDDTAEQIFPMTKVTDKTKKDIEEKLKQHENAKGNTNMREALLKAYDEIKSSENSGRNAMVILLSDGGDTYDLAQKFDETMKPFKSNGIPIYTIGMLSENNFYILKKISRESNGNYYSVKEVKDLKGVFNKIYMDLQQRLLVDKRDGVYESSSFYMILRILFIAVIGCLIAAGVSLTFDNKNLLKGFLVGGFIGGVVAGAIIEIGFLYFPWLGFLHRAFADIIMALIFTLIPIKVDVKNYSKGSYINKNKELELYNGKNFNNFS